MIDKEANKRSIFANIKPNCIVDHPKYSIIKDILLPLIAIAISCIALNYSNRAAQSSEQAVEISEKAAQEVKSNNELVNNYTVNMNKPTFNFRYSYGSDSKDIITSMDIENVGESLSTNTIQIYPYIEVLLRKNKSEEEFIQQEEVVYPSKDLYETILVPVGSDIYDIEYKNNRTGILATITQNTLYEKLIQEIEDCDETLQDGEKILCMRLKCYMDINYRALNNDDMVEVEKWNTGFVKMCLGAEYYKIKDEELGVKKIEEENEEIGDYKFVKSISRGRIIPNSRQSFTDEIEDCKEFSRIGFISLEVKRLDQFQYSKQVKGKPGDIVMFRIHMINTTGNRIDNWRVRILSAINMEYINGRTSVANATNPTGIRVSDNLNTYKGMNIGNYGEVGNAFIYFYARIGEEAKEVDKNIAYRLYVECTADPTIGIISDYADVLVTSE